MRNFFRLPAGDVVFVLALTCFAVVAFLPSVREATWAGMSMQGWMLALLMIFSPMVAIIRLLRSSKHQPPAKD